MILRRSHHTHTHTILNGWLLHFLESCLPLPPTNADAEYWYSGTESRGPWLHAVFPTTAALWGAFVPLFHPPGSPLPLWEPPTCRTASECTSTTFERREVISRAVTTVPTAPHTPNGWVLPLIHTVSIPFLGLPIRISPWSPTENSLPGDFSCPWPPGENSPFTHQTWLNGQHSLHNLTTPTLWSYFICAVSGSSSLSS